MREHVFTMTGNWQGGLNGHGQHSLRLADGRFSVPAEIGGLGVGTNPEELLLAAALSCYLISLAGMLQYRKLPVREILIRSEAVFHVEMGPTLKKICHFPEVHIVDKDEEKLQAIQECFLLAEKVCMVSNAIRANVQIEVQGSISSI